MEYTKVSLIEAVKELAQNAGIEIPDDYGKSEDRSEIQTLYDLHDWVMELYEKTLASTEGQEARNYLKKRGFSTEIIKKYHIGWAPAGWDFLLRATKDDKGAVELLEKAG